MSALVNFIAAQMAVNLDNMEASLNRLEAVAEQIRQQAEASRRWTAEVGLCPTCDENGMIPEMVDGSVPLVLCPDCEGTRQRQPYHQEV